MYELKGNSGISRPQSLRNTCRGLSPLEVSFEHEQQHPNECERDPADFACGKGIVEQDYRQDRNRDAAGAHNRGDGRDFTGGNCKHQEYEAKRSENYKADQQEGCFFREG